MRRLHPIRPAALRAALAGLAALASACSDTVVPPDGPQPPGQIQVRTQPAGATVGRVLATQPVVALLDCWDRLVDTSGVVVTASVASGNATIKSGGETTSLDGVATFKDLVIVGRTDAPVVLRFSIRHRSGVGTTVRNSAAINLEKGPAAGVQPNGQTTYSGNVGTVVSPAPSVTVIDAGGNPIQGARVTFTAIEGAGRLVDSVVTSDANGIARIGSWTLGLAGRNRLLAKIDDSTGTIFTATATSQIGALRIRVTGRPDGDPVPVRVVRTSVGSPAFDSTVKVVDTLTLTGIPFGTYAVTGDSVVRGNRIWLPRASFTNLVVSESSGPDVLLQYAEHGRVEITVRGLPGANIPVLVAVIPQDTATGLMGAITARNDAVVRALLPLGRYEFVLPSLGVGGQQYAPSPEKQIVSVASGETAAVSVNYVQSSGNLTVTVEGLPAGSTASIDITGPNGFRETVFMSGSRSYSGLAAGAYTITAANVTVGTQTLKPDSSPRTATVTAGGTSTVTFKYAP